MKEEIEMEKLIELLNEWQEKELWKAWAKYLMFDWINKVFRLNNGCSLCQELVLSNRFCFIKWLVDNDKIDLEKLDKKSERKPMYSFEEEWKIWFKLFEVYDSLLMLVAIQENPIEFLCSVLI